MTTVNATLPIDPAGRAFLVTGGAGFIGSHLVRRLVDMGARVRVLDAFTTGRMENLAALADKIELLRGDITDPATVREAMAGIEYVLHLAAIVSVTESVDNPEGNFAVNLAGTHNVLLAARDHRVRRVVFSSSCAVYGSQPPPQQEELAPRALSPYAAAKLGGEQLCRAFTAVYGLPTVCLRYFNVFGPHQNPLSTYAAAIPRFTTALLAGDRPQIYGDGRQSRDFVYVGNVVDANLLACATDAAVGEVFNIGTGQATSLLQLLAILGELTGRPVDPQFEPPRAGDIRHSFSDISRARRILGYEPATSLAEGLRETVAWYQAQTISTGA